MVSNTCDVPVVTGVDSSGPCRLWHGADTRLSRTAVRLSLPPNHYFLTADLAGVKGEAEQMHEWWRRAIFPSSTSQCKLAADPCDGE